MTYILICFYNCFSLFSFLLFLPCFIFLGHLSHYKWSIVLYWIGLLYICTDLKINTHAKLHKTKLVCLLDCSTVCFFVSLFGFFFRDIQIFSPICNLNIIDKGFQFDLYSAFTIIEKWGFFNVPHLLKHRTSFYTAIAEDLWHSHWVLSILQWSCHYACLND